VSKDSFRHLVSYESSDTLPDTLPERLTVTVPKRPARAGIDPRHLLMDVNPEDNTVDTKTEDAVLIGRN
jgi:hypothetical protein